MNKCLCCAKELSEGEVLYHASCRRMMFGKNVAPCLNYSLDELNDLAKHHVLDRISVPGVQPKLSLHLERPRGSGGARLTLVGLDGDFILKPPVKRWEGLPEAEHFCMMLAGRCGIKTAKFCLIPLKSGEFAYLSKRMDRTFAGALHMEDFCQILNKQTAQKYYGSMEQVGKAVRMYSTSPGLDCVRLFELAVFCFLTGNSDMHLKNFSLLRKSADCNELSPAYDLVPVKIILPEDTEELALTLNGKKSKLKAGDFEKFAESLRLSTVQAEKAGKRIVNAVQRNLEDAVLDSFLSDEMKVEMRDLVLTRLRRMM